MSTARQRSRSRPRTSTLGQRPSPRAAPRPASATPSVHTGRRGRLFIALCAACLLLAGGAIAWAIIRDGSGRGYVGGPTTGSGAPGAIASVSGTTGALLFQSVAAGDYWSQVGIVPLGQPEASRTMLPLRCLRVHVAATRGLCLAEGNGPPGSYSAYIFDTDLRVSDTVRLGGIPSRTRVSPDGRYGATTAFVAGHSYADDNFSTETLLIDLATGTTIANLEEFAASRDGKPFANEDFNYWGVTFAQDSTRFYASLGTSGTTYLVRGDIATRSLEVLRENVECPSLSPDETRIAFKKRVSGNLGVITWRFYALDLATMTETPLAEPRSIDDQIMWLDNSQVLYGDGTDTWIMAADGSGTPRRYLSHALSATILPPANEASGSPPAGVEVVTLPDADLAVSIDPPAAATTGEPATYTLTVTNDGPSAATDVVVDHYLPPGATYGAATTTGPPGLDYGCAIYPEENRVRCDTLTLPPDVEWTISVTITPGMDGPAALAANTGATENDPAPDNNRADASFSVGP